MSDRKMQRIVAVFGGNREVPPVLDLARHAGIAVARSGAVLLTGGRHDAGCDHVKDCAMAAAATVPWSRILGVLPDSASATRVEPAGPSSRAGYVGTGLGDARNVLNGYACDAAIALPGGAGTISEVVYSLQAGRPVALLGWDRAGLQDRLHQCRTDLAEMLGLGAAAFPNAALPRLGESERLIAGAWIEAAGEPEDAVRVVGARARDDRCRNAVELLASSDHGAVAGRLESVIRELIADE